MNDSIKERIRRPGQAQRIIKFGPGISAEMQDFLTDLWSPEWHPGCDGEVQGRKVLEKNLKHQEYRLRKKQKGFKDLRVKRNERMKV